MKKLLTLFLSIALSFASSLHSMEHIFKILNQPEYFTHIWDTCMKKFDESSWSVKLPIIFVGSCACLKTFEGAYSWLFGKKAPSQADITATNQRLDLFKQWSDVVNERLGFLDEKRLASELSIAELERLNPQKRNIETIKALSIVLDSKVLSLEDKYKRLSQAVDAYNVIILGQRDRSKKKDQRLSTIEENLGFIVQCVSPRSKEDVEKESRWEKGKDKEKNKKDKKKEKKESFRKTIEQPEYGTPRFGYSNFDTDTEEEGRFSLSKGSLNAISENAQSEVGSNLRPIKPLNPRENVQNS